jgi:4-carboxymuconolactone decarboxylase
MRTSNEIYDTGLAIRREMFGPAGSDNAIANAGPFKGALEDMVTRYCFGEIWSGSDLDRKTRSLVTVAITAALGRQTALRSHVRGAVANGASAAELRGVLLHTMLYAGIPAAVDAFNQSAEVLKELGVDPSAMESR